MKISRNILNIILFQVGWWGCLYLAYSEINNYILLGFVSVLVILQFIYVVPASLVRNEIKFYLIVSVCGYLADGVFASLGVLSFNDASGLIAPLWLLGMWMLFPLTIGYGFSWLQGRYIFSFFLGAIGGPLTYKVGSSFALVDIIGAQHVIFYSLHWGIVFVACIYFYKTSVLQRTKL